jgi:uncharacterized damage-inducible protein DinB
MSKQEMRRQLDFTRTKTLATLDAIAKRTDANAALSWRPAPGRAHIAWQLMHIGATDDRHLNVRIGGGTAREPEYEQRFAGGSTPDDQIPTIEEIRRYLEEHRRGLLALLDAATDESLAAKPYATSPYTLEEWFRLWAWHEAHHQGQAHLTLNMYKALHGA